MVASDDSKPDDNFEVDGITDDGVSRESLNSPNDKPSANDSNGHSKSNGIDNTAFGQDDDRKEKALENKPEIVVADPEKSKSRKFLKFGSRKKKKEEEKPKTVSLWKLFRFADRIDVVLMLCGSVCALIHGVAFPALLLIFGNISESFVGSTQFIQNGTMSDIQRRYFLDETIRPKCYEFAGIGFGVMFLAYGQVMFWLTTSHRQTHRIRTQFFRAVLRQEIGWFDTHEIGEISTKLTDDISKIQAGIGDKIGAVLQSTSTFITGIVIALVIGWKLALVILSTTPLLGGCAAIMMYLITSSTKRESDAYAKAGAIAQEDLSAIRTVVVFGGEEKECQRYSVNLKLAKKFGIRKSIVNGAGMGVTQFVILGTYALAFWYGGTLTVPDKNNNYYHEYTIGSLLIVFFCTVLGAFALGSAFPSIQFIASARSCAHTIWGIIDRRPEIDSMSEDGTEPNSLTGNVDLRNVKFRYPSRPDVEVLKGLNLKIARGQTVALVGSSGCGKSTVIQLIQRFYDPLEGVVMIDGTDIRLLNIRWLRQHIGVVSQEPVLFATTIAENIRYGREGVTQAEIEQAAKEANAHDFISKLPLKYETLVGERGAQVSGGQKQRIAIARALVRDPKILLLDEATSALDTESEATVQAALDKARQGRTTIVVAHRLSTIRSADLIYAFKDGIAQECGTHDELMELKGIYYQLVNQQNIGDNDDDDEEDEELEEGDLSSAGFDRVGSISGIRGSLRRHGSIASRTSIPVEDDQTTPKKDKEADVSGTRILKLNSPEWIYIVIGCIMSLIHGGIQPIYGIIFGGFLASYRFEDQPDKMMNEIIFYALMFLVIGGATAISMFFEFWMFGISGEALTMRLRQMTFRCFLKQDMSYFDDPKNSVGALTTRLATDASAVPGATGVRLGMLTMVFANIGVGLIIGFVFSWKFILFIIGVVPFLLFWQIAQNKLFTGFSKSNKALENAGKVANESLSNIRTVCSLTKEPMFVQEYEKLNAPIYRQNLKKSQVIGIMFGFVQSMTFFVLAAIFYFGAWLIAYDGLSYENMFKTYVSIVYGAVAIGRDSVLMPDYGKAKSSAARIFSLFDKEPPIIDNFSTEGLKPNQCSGCVEFQDVRFSYPMRQTVTVLRNLSLKVEQGNTIALVGSSGCGKSTTVQLLERLYDVLAGQVSVDGNDVRSLNVSWLRSQLGLVSQEPTLFGYSIRENIAYGDNSRQVNMDEIIAAAKQANIHNFIQSLPEGYETKVGDRGTQLSGGQKQRIAIARALVRNPKILLLDEATSALDTESEKIVQEALDRAQEGRTCLVIAHRLSTIQNADCIFVFQHGHITERGTHAELMERKGLYYKLVVTQGYKR